MDRQDIDALLISALYGELTPADEARLATHLESHPADRGALDDLKVARQAVLDSRIFAVQLDPPQAVSALLLQEAHRRAPKRAVAADGEQKESWFFRFTRSFMAHPAMAAAAMLVLVLGGAGILWVKKGDHVATQEVSNAAVADQRVAPAGAAAQMPDPAAAGSAAFNADLYEGGTGAALEQASPADKAADGKADDDEATAADRWENQQELAKEQRQTVASERNRKAARGIRVETEKGALKEYDGDSKKQAAAKDTSLSLDDFAGADRVGGAKGGETNAHGMPSGGGAGMAAPGAAAPRADSAPAPAPSTGYAQPPPPPPPTVTANKPTATAQPRAPEPAKKAPATTSTTTAPPAQTIARPAEEKPAADAGASTKSEAKRDESSLVAWAKGEHSRAVALAQKGECSAAAKVALGVSNRASSYYAQYMATDRALKQCAAYISAERDRDAERSGKARAKKAAPADTK